MLPLIYVGLITFISSFTLTHSITREILRFNFERKIEDSKPKIDDFKQNSKVKFKTDINVRYIPSRTNLSTTTLNKLWYTNKDYEIFKINYQKLKKHNSI